MYICNRCGNQIAEGKRFCNQCGEPVRYWDPEQRRVPDPEPEAQPEAADAVLDAADDVTADMPAAEADDAELAGIWQEASLDDPMTQDTVVWNPAHLKTVKSPAKAYQELEDEEFEEERVIDEDDDYDADLAYEYDPDEDDMDDDIDSDDVKPLHGQNRQKAQKNQQKTVNGRKPKKREENRTINKILTFVVPVIMIIAIVCCFVLGMRYQQSCNQKLSTFNAEIKAYQEVLDTYPKADQRFVDLLNEAEDIFETKDYASFDTYSQLMADARVSMINEYASETKLAELKETYVEKLKNFKIQDANKTLYDSVMKRLDDAISAKDAKDYGKLEKDLQDLEQAIRTDNENMVQSLRNEIAKIDLSSASYADRQQFDTYGEEVNKAIANDDYVKALELLTEWRTKAKKLDNKLNESESREKAKAESESKAKAERESKEKAESESKAKAESESKAAEEGETTAPSEAPNNFYVLPESSSRYLTPQEIVNLSAWEKFVARNEIYARHGRRFNDQSLQTYFDSQAWYHGTISPSDFDDSSISDVEMYNATLIKQYE